MRKIYESEEDRYNEGIAKIIMEKKWSCRLVKTPPLHCVDFEAYRGPELIALIEFKKSNSDSRAWKLYMIGKEKLEKGKSRASQLGVRFLLVVQFIDKFGWIEIKHLNYQVKLKGRTIQTRDKWDIRECYFIPIKEFKRL